MKRFVLVSLCAVLLTLGSFTPARAEPWFKGMDYDSSYISDKFSYSVGWFGAEISTDIALGFGNNLGTLIRLEEDLTLQENKDSLMLEATWRFSRKRALYFFGTKLNRSGSNVIERTIDIDNPNDPDGGFRFDIGAAVQSEFDNKIFGFIYRYSLFNNGKMDAGISGGLSFYDFELGLFGQATAIDEDGNPVGGGTNFSSATGDFIAPIPTIGIHMAYALNPRWIFRFKTDLLDLEFGDYEGRITQSRTDIQWFFVENVSVGAGVITNNIEFSDVGDDPFRVDYRYSGFTAFIGASF
jgi:hypothetical protein